MLDNPLLEAFRSEGHGWAQGLLKVLDDFESRLQMLGSDPPDAEPSPGNGGAGDESGT